MRVLARNQCQKNRPVLITLSVQPKNPHSNRSSRFRDVALYLSFVVVKFILVICFYVINYVCYPVTHASVIWCYLSPLYLTCLSITHTQTHIHTFTHTHTHPHTHQHTPTSTHTPSHTQTHTYPHQHTHTRTLTHTQIYIYIYIYIQIQKTIQLYENQIFNVSFASPQRVGN